MAEQTREQRLEAALRRIAEHDWTEPPGVMPDQMAREALADLPQAQTGDWVGQIYWKLPNLDYRPNATAQEIADRALQAERQRREEAEQAADELAEAVSDLLQAADEGGADTGPARDALAHYKEARR